MEALPRGGRDLNGAVGQVVSVVGQSHELAVEHLHFFQQYLLEDGAKVSVLRFEAEPLEVVALLALLGRVFPCLLLPPRLLDDPQLLLDLGSDHGKDSLFPFLGLHLLQAVEVYVEQS